MFKTSARRSRRDAQEKDDRKRPRFGAGMAVRHGVSFGNAACHGVLFGNAACHGVLFGNAAWH